MSKVDRKVELGNETYTRWVNMGHPGYFGKKRDEIMAGWNKEFGEENWRLANVTKEGEIYSFNEIIGRVMIPGYVRHFDKHPDEAGYILENYSYGYDKDLISKTQAFDPYFFYQKQGVANQFHHVAFNIALNDYHGPFKGNKALQVRQGKPGTPVDTWPAGWRWSPGFIESTRPDLIPDIDIDGWWASETSIEAFYQKTKTLQVRA